MFKEVSVSPRMVLVILGLTAGMLSAMAVTLPYTGGAADTTFTATVSEQCTVTVPPAVAFAVTNTSVSTASIGYTVTIAGIVLADGKAIQVSIAANTAAFSKPTGATLTWAASDVSWASAGGWAGATGTALSLSNTTTTYTEVATSTANQAATAEVTDLVFTLAAKSTIDRSGAYALACTWKVASVTP